MTHPTRAHLAGTLSVSEAMRRISDKEMTMMCLTINQAMGSSSANRLLDLFGSARREITREAT